MGPTSEIIPTFDHFSTQLALVGFRVKMSKCKLWSPSGNSLNIKFFYGYILVTNGLCILVILSHFFNEVLSQEVAHIDDLPLFENTQVALGILSLCVIHEPSYFTQTILPFSFPSFLVSFNKRIMQICGDIMGLRSSEFIKGPLMGCQAQLLIFFYGIGFLSMRDCVASTFLGS